MLRVPELLTLVFGFQDRANPRSVNPTTIPAKISTVAVISSPFSNFPNLCQRDFSSSTFSAFSLFSPYCGFSGLVVPV